MSVTPGFTYASLMGLGPQYAVETAGPFALEGDLQFRERLFQSAGALRETHRAAQLLGCRLHCRSAFGPVGDVPDVRAEEPEQGAERHEGRMIERMHVEQAQALIAKARA